MTEAHLEKIIKTSEEIKRYKKFLKAFDSPYINQVLVYDWECKRRVEERLLLENEPELEKLIRDYFVRKIEALEKEFAEL